MRSPASLNIQEKLKTSDKNRTDLPATSPGGDLPCEIKIATLVNVLRSPDWAGDVLRVLTRRLRYPGLAYTSKELEILLLVTVALERAGMWP